MLSSPEMAIQPAPALEDDDEDMLEATQVEEPAPLKSKKRKLVSKTVMGEDGFVGKPWEIKRRYHLEFSPHPFFFSSFSHHERICDLR